MPYNSILRALLLTLLLSNSLFSQSLLENIKKAASSKYWNTLLHFKNGKSQIESKNFFLNEKGNQNSFLELNSTISNLINPIQKDDNSTYCKFPARRIWIQNNIKNINIKKQTCLLLQKELKEIENITQVTLIFPTTHINSPASMFGHTLLRLDDKNSDLLNSYAINYAAFTNEENGFIYAWKGLTGGYQGKYSIVPYFKKLNEYNNIENRDIWEYKLNLTQEEIERLKYHLFEIKYTSSKYYYFNRNCSYEILWLLQSARKNIQLTKAFTYKTLPIDSIKEIRDNNLIQSVKYRASKGKYLLSYYNLIQDKNLANDFYLTLNNKLIMNQSLNQKQTILNYTLELLRYENLNNKLKKKVYLRKLIKLLRIRSKLGIQKDLKLKKPVNPINGHKASKIGISLRKNTVALEIKPAFHSQDSLNNGFIQGAYIDFLKLNLSLDKNKKTRLENFSFFDIKSYAKRNDIFKPISWQIDVGNEVFKNNKNYAKIKTGTGLSYGKSNFLNSFLILADTHYRNHLELSYGLGYNLEYSLNTTKIVLDYKIKKHTFKTNDYLDFYLVKKINKEINFKIGFEKDLYDKDIYAGLSYYF